MHETIYQLCNLAILPAWLALLFAPEHRATERFVHSGGVSALFCAVYSYLLFSGIGGESQGGFSTLADLSLMFSRPEAALVGWVHYVALDLMIGSWELKDMARCGVSMRWRFLILPLTLLLAPFGLLVYLGLRLALARPASIESAIGER